MKRDNASIWLVLACLFAVALITYLRTMEGWD